MSLDINELVELDRLNMAPIIEQADGRFDPEFRRSKMLLEQEKGAEFIVIGRGGVIVAYLEYLQEFDGILSVLPIQIHPSHQNGFVLRDLLGEAGRRLPARVPVDIRSSVHATNRTSLSLHVRLGFVETGKSADRILFRTDSARLSDRLNRFHRKKVIASDPQDKDGSVKPRRV